jgi:hypothetical protein
MSTMMSSYYDPPEDGPGFIEGPDWYVTTYQINERDEEVIASLTDLLHWQRTSRPGDPNLYQAIKDVAEKGHEVFIRYGYAWAMEEDAAEWMYADSYVAAQDAIDSLLFDAKEAMAEAAMEAARDRD